MLKRVHFAALDLDGVSREVVDKLKALLEPNSYLMCTTWSHVKSYDETGLCYLRVFIELSRPAEIREWKRFWAGLNQYVGGFLDEEPEPGEPDVTLFKLAALLAEQWPNANPGDLAGLFKFSLFEMASQEPDAPTLDDVVEKISRKQSQVKAQKADQSESEDEELETRILNVFSGKRSHGYTEHEAGQFAANANVPHLRTLAGEFQEKLLDWVATVTMVKSQIAALYLHGVRGAGKNLLREAWSRDFVWNINSGKSTTSKYRQRDNYLRFYLKYVEPKRALVKQNIYYDAHLENLSHWHTIMGLQFQNRVLNNMLPIITKLNIAPETIISAAPYFQNQTTRQKAAQIDSLIHTEHTLYVCEIKFRKTLGMAIITEMAEKIKRLKIPIHVSVRPVIIYQGSLSETVVKSNYFSHLLRFSDLLE